MGAAHGCSRPGARHPGWWGLTWQPVPLPPANTRPVFQRSVTIGGLSITSPSDWVLVDYLGLWNADAVPLDNTTVPVFELTNFDPGLSTPVCDTAPGGPTRLPADGVAILAVVGNEGGSLDDSLRPRHRRVRDRDGQLRRSGAVSLRPRDGSDVDRAGPDGRRGRSCARSRGSHPSTRMRGGSHLGTSSMATGMGLDWWLLEARPLRGGVRAIGDRSRTERKRIERDVYSSLPSESAIYAENEGWVGVVAQDAAKVEFYRERGGAPIEGRVLDLPPGLPFPFDAWWFGPQLGQNWSGETVAVGHDGTILGSTVSPLVQSLQVGTLRAFGARWRVKDSRSANGWHAQACVEPTSAPTSQPCDRRLGGGLFVQTFSRAGPRVVPLCGRQ